MLQDSENSSVTERICPYCKSSLSDLTPPAICEDCGTAHHLDCWKANRKCSVFGCQSFDISLPARRHRDPAWLLVLRFLVLGTYPITAMANHLPPIVGLWLIAWFLAEIILVPVFLAAEIYCLWAVVKGRETPRYAGSERGHIISLSIFVSLVVVILITGRVVF